MASQLKGNSNMADSPWETIHDRPVQKRFFEDIIKKNKLENLQLFFKSEVLDKYRGDSAYKIIRTDSSGRISKPGAWALDFGIASEDRLIHFPVERWIHNLPDVEREHWLMAMVNLPLSDNFVKGLVGVGCLDDGAIRKWE
ncbi:hypothetical protein NC797_17360 [Aquibacillus sp. 3ASR75-11]|uniref:Uncharacterized protein n=1 Tax=Terrihalobacillus insolitus TaxID=2950438 RepID=A0A9X4AQ86_9BACI|nr:hypothetical protein [Terrihalobacillus insolitus]MDC3413281.1 hypothetical protein [Terrihalobacillus insolitus]MDC3426265.1 hypothetical protein [Terrihalobacillus insolitus]